MKLTSLASLENLPYFTIESVRRLEAHSSPATLRAELYRWMKAGRIIRLKNGVYMTRRFFENHHAEADFAPMVSATLLPTSYVSLEYVLQRHGVLVNGAYPVAAVTPKQARVIENAIGIFAYHNIKSSFYTGYTITEYMNIPIAQAGPAKALFDLFYLRPLRNKKHLTEIDLADSLGLSLGDFTATDREEFIDYVENCDSPKMNAILKNLKKHVWRP